MQHDLHISTLLGCSKWSHEDHLNEAAKTLPIIASPLRCLGVGVRVREGEGGGVQEEEE